MEKIRVLHVCGTMNRGGAEMMLMNIYRNISDRFEFIFLINVLDLSNIPQGSFDEEIRSLGGRILYIGSQWKIGLLAYIKEFKKIVKSIGHIDVVHSHMNAKSGVIALAARLSGVKKVIAHSHADIHFYGSFIKKLPNLVELKFQKVLINSFATDYWACSNEAASSLFYVPKRNKVEIIRNAVPVRSYLDVGHEKAEEIRKALNIGPETAIIGNVGRINPKKNIVFLVKVLESVINKGIDAVLVYTGRVEDEPYQKEICMLTEALGLKGKVFHLGEQSDIPGVLSAFDLFASASVTEGFGMVALEAQASGLPCILSPGFPADVDMGLNLVEFMSGYDAEEWAEAIIERVGCRCPDKARILKEIAARGYDAKENTAKIESLYIGGIA